MMDKNDKGLLTLLLHSQPVECSRPRKDPQAFRECLDRNYVHIMFKDTRTEVGVQLFRPACRLDGGTVHIEGSLMLDYNPVKCIADISLPGCEGTACLVPVSGEEYHRMTAGNKQ